MVATNGHFPGLLAKTGMSTQATPPHTPRQNMSCISPLLTLPCPILQSKVKNFSFKEKQMLLAKGTQIS